MALITVLSHFQQPTVTLPNDTVNTLLSASIASYEPEYLKKIFGYKMYNDFIVGLDANTTKWVTLRDGATYEDTSGILRKWEGFSQPGKNPIACYVYFKYLSDVRYNATNSGVKLSKTENMETGDTRHNQVRAYNAMVEFNWELHQYLYANQTDFPDYIGLVTPPDKRLRYDITENQNLFIPINHFGF